MRSTSREEKFAAEIIDRIELHMVNEVRFNMLDLLNNLKSLDPPDFICEKHYFEKFEADGFKKFDTKSGKKSSLNKRNLDKMKSRVNTTQDIFRTVSFWTPEELSNTKYLKENIIDLITIKTHKQPNYLKHYPQGVYKHLIIDIVTRIEVFTDQDGDFFEEVVNSAGLKREEYQVYLDRNFITRVKEEFGDRWDVLVFIRKKYRKGEPYFPTFCIDLKKDIKDIEMIDYPDKLFQVCHGKTQNYTIKGNCSTTNIYYKLDQAINLHGHLEAETIKINDTILRKHVTLDSVYVSDDEAFYFETSQLVCAINPDTESADTYLYIRYLVNSTLHLSIDSKEFSLNRITPVETFYYYDGDKGFYKKSNELTCVILDADYNGEE